MRTQLTPSAIGQEAIRNSIRNATVWNIWGEAHAAVDSNLWAYLDRGVDAEIRNQIGDLRRCRKLHSRCDLFDKSMII